MRSKPLTQDELKKLIKEVFSQHKSKQNRATSGMVRIVQQDRLRSDFCKEGGVSLLVNYLNSYMHKINNDGILLVILWVLFKAASEGNIKSLCLTDIDLQRDIEDRSMMQEDYLCL
jgi:hypothetical protein